MFKTECLKCLMIVIIVESGAEKFMMLARLWESLLQTTLREMNLLWTVTHSDHARMTHVTLLTYVKRWTVFS